MPDDSAAADARRLERLLGVLIHVGALDTVDDAEFIKQQFDSRDAALREASAEIEDWRGRFATSLGETLAARMERDSLRAEIARLNEDSVLQEDLRDMLRALGLHDGARPQSPHEVFRECISAVAHLRAAPSARVVKAARELLELSGRSRQLTHGRERLEEALAEHDAAPPDDGWRPIEKAAIAWYEAGRKLTAASPKEKLNANRAHSLAHVALFQAVNAALPPSPDAAAPQREPGDG